MSWTADKVEVACPRCGEFFDDWVRPNHDPAISATCPACGHRLDRDASIRQDGALHAAAADIDEPDR